MPPALDFSWVDMTDPARVAVNPQIFREYAPFVWRGLRRLGVPECDVEDVCQEVFVVVHRKLGDFEGRSSLRTWIYGICARTASAFVPSMRARDSSDSRAFFRRQPTI